MKIFKEFTILTLAFAVGSLGIGLGLPADAQAQIRRTTRTNRMSDNQVEQIIKNVESRSDVFRRSFDAALDRSRLNGTYTEDEVNNRVKAFEDATNELRSRFNGRNAAASDVENVLNRAASIDQFMRSNLQQRRVQGDWSLLKADLQRLARAYNVTFDFNGNVLPSAVVGSQQPYRVSDSQVKYLLSSIESKSDVFRRSLDTALDHSRFNGTNREDNINDFVKGFENSTDELKNRFDGRTSVKSDAENVLVRAARIDDFMRRNLRREYTAQRDWTSLRTSLNQLSNYYGLGFNLDNRNGMPPFSDNGTGVLMNGDSSFTGTYRLNAAQSDNAQNIANNATRYIRTNNRDTINTRLFNRLQAPEMIAVQRQGTRVMLASSRSPQITLDVDNVQHVESYPNGRASQVRASFSGDTLTIVSNGDRTNDFTAIFTSLDNGRRMLVTRRVYAEQLGQPVEVKSYYDRTTDAADFNLAGGNYGNTTVVNNGGSAYNNFYVPNNTMLSATLNSNISTKTSQNGERFTMTVNSPSQYAGAVIEGYVSNLERSGRVSGRSGVTLNYETIRLPNNQTYRFAGFTESATAANGDRVQIGNEGGVEADNSQTKTTVQRTAIGAGIGALLGAIIGGGQGAAIGAGVGAGAGVGSVYVQGRDDLELVRGSEVTVRASAPRVNQ